MKKTEPHKEPKPKAKKADNDKSESKTENNVDSSNHVDTSGRTNTTINKTLGYGWELKQKTKLSKLRRNGKKQYLHTIYFTFKMSDESDGKTVGKCKNCLVLL